MDHLNKRDYASHYLRCLAEFKNLDELLLCFCDADEEHLWFIIDHFRAIKKLTLQFFSGVSTEFYRHLFAISEHRELHFTISNDGEINAEDFLTVEYTSTAFPLSKLEVLDFNSMSFISINTMTSSTMGLGLPFFQVIVAGYFPNLRSLNIVCDGFGSDDFDVIQQGCPLLQELQMSIAKENPTTKTMWAARVKAIQAGDEYEDEHEPMKRPTFLVEHFPQNWRCLKKIKLTDIVLSYEGLISVASCSKFMRKIDAAPEGKNTRTWNSIWIQEMKERFPLIQISSCTEYIDMSRVDMSKVKIIGMF